MKIIGITGTLGAGKGTVVDYLVKEKGFNHFSVRAFLIEEIEKRGMPVNRDSMTFVGNDLREKHQPSYIVEQLYNQAKESGTDCIIESVRNVGEVEALQSKGGFALFAVDANPKIRYDRIVQRKSETDNISYEVFVENEQREMSSTDPNKQNISKCVEMADYVLLNDGAIEELNLKVEEILNGIK